MNTHVGFDHYMGFNFSYSFYGCDFTMGFYRVWVIVEGDKSRVETQKSMNRTLPYVGIIYRFLFVFSGECKITRDSYDKVSLLVLRPLPVDTQNLEIL